jgi:HlyD family secretion protein
MSLIDFSVIHYKKKLYIIGGILILSLVGLVLFSFPTKKQTTVAVKRGSVVQTLLINGSYTTASQVAVNSSADGVITQLFVHSGDTLKKSAPLFHVESTATEQEKAAAYANYLTASSALQEDKATMYSVQSIMFDSWKKYTDLSTNNTYQNSDKSPNNDNRKLPEFVIAQDNWLAAEAHYKNQQGVLAKDQATLAAATLSYNATQNITVLAPSAGTVVNLQKKIGDHVQSVQTALNAQTQSGQTASVIPPVLVISDLSNPQISATVDQVNIPRIAIGQKATIVFDALPDQSFNGVVESIDTVGVKMQGTVTYAVGVRLENASEMLKPNMTASLTLETARRDDVLIIPNTAIVEKDGKTYVQRDGGSQKDLILVHLGLKDLKTTEVLSGVSLGDTLLLQ